ncbi:Maf family nucleotide pyrophosphatase [Algoriphagus sediminis]|uniref:dTTP/UTP pyrophosphatase n=1 Tax=Algoriphagus sediminis TaxID=3057113 RepID=A0ABT7YAM6_9BACT|nr:Maf family nucleotide pyrophosphatase [Algoriphagus sediminis]MDN3203566.1 Maf family nucleotide pyrophosphatase [Algoriphagus sediminis]
MEPFLEKLKDKSLILASGSPRRQELLRGLELEFEIKPNSVDEDIPEGIPATFVAAYLSKLKSDSFPEELKPNEILITSDTVVVLGKHVLGKPKNESEAFDMLKSISGATHEVMTAVTLRDSLKTITLEDQTSVTFKMLTEEEIWHYIKEYKPFDKAGAYGIQEWIGFIGVSKIEGSYFNVMGFPLHLVYEQLKKW